MPASDSSRRLLKNHQRCWIWGRHVVTETLAAGTWPILELWLADDLDDTEAHALRTLADERQVPVTVTTRSKLEKNCRGEDHQGLAARMSEFPYADWSALLQRIHDQALVIILDGIQDSFNLGTMLRSAEVFNATGVVLGSTGQAGVNSQVARSSVGAINRLPICRVENLQTTVRELTAAGVYVAGTHHANGTDIDQFDCRRPLALVIGSETRGISPELSAACTGLVRIPQPGQTNSLNAAAALAIACYEVRRQQRVS